MQISNGGNALKLNLKPMAASNSAAGEVPNKMMKLLSVQLKETSGLDDEKKIVALVNSIDDQITQLDNRMDLVLEQHEKDFLSAYRKHMVAVQKELTELKLKGTETELQLKQDKKIG